MDSYGLRGQIYSQGIHILTKEDQSGQFRGKGARHGARGMQSRGIRAQSGARMSTQDPQNAPLQEAMAAFNCTHPVARWGHRVNAGFLLSQGLDMVAPMIPTPLFPGIRGSILALLEK